MLSVYHNRRFDNDFLTIKKLLGENRVGNVYAYESNFDRFRPMYVIDGEKKSTRLRYII